eukprot:gnl/TRDRNA2_/TRDRNA2_104819_c0_seq1.p1 gnl/TRDRNA2_/TRDRNA2_104819_c0~~gnl/TRDRNA2_/TRDRNA2_104819_c0_seq1.p1  ORF type:complete len:222 (-),score=13.81 gnl/TRDRNA2_/TRDRNA2_104819_c0_seq1:157-822(-)
MMHTNIVILVFAFADAHEKFGDRSSIAIIELLDLSLELSGWLFMCYVDIAHEPHARYECRDDCAWINGATTRAKGRCRAGCMSSGLEYEPFGPEDIAERAQRCGLRLAAMIRIPDSACTSWRAGSLRSTLSRHNLSHAISLSASRYGRLSCAAIHMPETALSLGTVAKSHMQLSQPLPLCRRKDTLPFTSQTPFSQECAIRNGRGRCCRLHPPRISARCFL